jgi:beta-lactamase superfamily II metal-dependent hydrolase
MKLTLLSPTNSELGRLRPIWLREVQKAGLDPQVPIAEEEDLNTLPSGLERLGGLELPDVDVLAETPFESDDSEANGSSIAVLAEYDEKSALLCGDAFPDVLKTSLEKLNKERGLERLPLDAFKPPHHGSKANISVELLEKIHCTNYLISTNGAYHQHPDNISVARILKYGGSQPHLFFNYSSKYNKNWSNATLQNKFGFKTTYPMSELGGYILNFG